MPVDIGQPQGDIAQTHAAWLGNYTLDSYQGPVLDDGVRAICDTVMRSAEPVTLICIGPVPNIAAALSREPRLTRNSRFSGMHGSLRRGYLGAAKPMREYNVAKHSLAAQQVFATPWDTTIKLADVAGY